MDTPVTSLRINASRLPRTLALVAALLLVAHGVLVTYDLTVSELPWLVVQLFDVDEEHNLPTWFSGFNLLLATGVLWMCASWKREQEDRFSRRWSILFYIFFLLAIDEIAGLHESINTAIDPTWALGGAVIALVLALYYVPFLKHLPKDSLITFVLAGAMFVGGAVGMEIVGEPMDSDSLVYNLTTMVEEGLEMFGVILFIRGLLVYMKDQDGANYTVQIT